MCSNSVFYSHVFFHRVFAYAFVSKCVPILWLVGIMFFIYATWFSELNIMYGITSLPELLFRLNLSHILIKTTLYGYSLLSKCVVILYLVGNIFFICYLIFCFLNIMHGITSFHEILFRLSLSHVLIKKGFLFMLFN